MTRRVISFDLDGVIADTFGVHIQGWKAVCAELGFPLGINDYEWLKGVSTELAIKKLLCNLQVSYDSETLLNLVILKNSIRDHLIDKILPEDINHRVSEILGVIKRSDDVAVCFATSSKTQDVLKLLGVTNYFDEVYCGEKIRGLKTDEVDAFVNHISLLFDCSAPQIYHLDDCEKVCTHFSSIGANGILFPDCLYKIYSLYGIE